MTECGFEASYQLSRGDYVRTLRAHCLRQAGPPLLVVFLVALIVSGMLLGVEGMVNASAGMLVGILYVLFQTFVLVPRSVRAIYREQRSAGEIKRFKVTKEGLQIDQDSGVFRAEWADLVRWIETSSTMAVYVNRAMLIPLPKSDLGVPCTSHIRECMIASGLPRPWKLRKS